MEKVVSLFLSNVNTVNFIQSFSIKGSSTVQKELHEATQTREKISNFLLELGLACDKCDDNSEEDGHAKKKDSNSKKFEAYLPSLDKVQTPVGYKQVLNEIWTLIIGFQQPQLLSDHQKKQIFDKSVLLFGKKFIKIVKCFTSKI